MVIVANRPEMEKAKEKVERAENSRLKTCHVNVSQDTLMTQTTCLSGEAGVHTGLYPSLAMR